MIFDLSRRAKLRISGSDRVRYLNGQISNDLRKASAERAIHACVLSAKGKINADIFITAEADSFLIDTEAEMGEQLAARLERYIIADDVQIDDVTEAFALFHVVGVEAPNIESGHAAQADRFGVAGTDLRVERARHDEVLQELARKLPICDEACAEIFRIEQGVPRWGRELTEEIIPTEANLETSAIDYAKGCYIGQEVISRIKMSGQTNKRLCGLVSVGEVALAAGMRLVAEGKDVGWITSATISERLRKQVALGFVKRGFQKPGRRLDGLAGADRPSAVAEIVELPF